MAYGYGPRAARVCYYVPVLIISYDIYHTLDELNQLCWCNGKKKKKKLPVISDIDGLPLLSYQPSSIG